MEQKQELLPKVGHPSTLTPDELRVRVKSNYKKINEGWSELSFDLYIISNRGLFTEWGYQSFDDYIEKDLSIPVGRAHKLTRMFKKYVKELGLKPEEYKDIGFSKAALLSPIIEKTNSKQWIEVAKTLSYKELDLEVKKAKKQKRKFVITDEKPMEEQALVQPLNSAIQPSLDAEDFTLTKRTFFLSNSQNELLNAVLEEVSRTSSSTKDSFLLTLALQGYLASGNAGMAKIERPFFWLKQFEISYGGKLIWLKEEKETKELIDLINTTPTLKGLLSNGNQEKKD